RRRQPATARSGRSPHPARAARRRRPFRQRHRQRTKSRQRRTGSKISRTISLSSRVLRLKTGPVFPLHPILYLRTIGRAAGLQRVREQFDPILPPEYLAVEHIDRRSEHVRRQCILAVLLVGRADLVGPRTLNQLLAGKPRIVSHFNQRRGIGQVELAFPDAGKSPPQKGIRIVSSLDR